MFATVLLVSRYLIQPAARIELGPRSAILTFEPVHLDPSSFGELELKGAWKVTSPDPRFGGVSALAIDGDEFIALTDSGVIIRYPKQLEGKLQAIIHELPDGPGDPGYKVSRDSESLVRDPLGRGWWVGFENRNQLWLYDRQFGRALRRIRFDRKRWKRNSGIEGLAGAGSALLLFPEPGRTVVRIKPPGQQTLRMTNPRGRISDAARLPSGHIVVIHRRPTLRGFTNALSMIVRSIKAYRVAGTQVLGLGALDNAEALAAERLPGGGIRLWVMTDDNFRRPLRTLLVALDLPVRPRAAKPSS